MALQEGATALHSAAYNGHKGVVSQLVEDGADVNVVTKVGSLSWIFDYEMNVNNRLVGMLLNG